MGGASSIHAVVFDLDGTLIDSYGAIAECFNHARLRLGEPALPEAQVRRLVGHGLEALMEAAVGRERAAEGVRLFRERYDAICESRTLALPEVPETLRELRRRRVAMGVATNKPARFARRILRALDLMPPLQVVEGPDGEVPPKPDPSMVLRVLGSLACPRESAVYVGDMQVDVVTARRAGVRVWVLATGSCTREELIAAHPDRVLERFGDLQHLVGGADAP